MVGDEGKYFYRQGQISKYSKRVFSKSWNVSIPRARSIRPLHLLKCCPMPVATGQQHLHNLKRHLESTRCVYTNEYADDFAITEQRRGSREGKRQEAFVRRTESENDLTREFRWRRDKIMTYLVAFGGRESRWIEDGDSLSSIPSV